MKNCCIIGKKWDSSEHFVLISLNLIKNSHSFIINLRYLNDLEEKIPSNEIDSIKDYIMKEIEKIDPKFEATFCGSYRRG
jgi:hypothetical protein